MPDTTCELFSEKLASCFDLFKKKGLRSVSIQDIVRSSNISKKELYDTFGNKGGIIQEVFNQDLIISKKILEEASLKSENAIQELFHVHTNLMNRYGNINQVLFFDLNKYYNEISTDHMERKLAMNLDFITKNIERGVTESLFRKDINIQIVARLWVSKFEMIQQQKWFPLSQFDLKKLAEEFILLHLRSICNNEGLNTLESYLKRKNILQS